MQNTEYADTKLTLLKVVSSFGAKGKMSFFSSKADRNLPALTKFYQLDVDWENHEVFASYDCAKDTELFKFFGADGIRPECSTSCPFSTDEGYFLQDLAEFHRCVCILMEALADDSMLMGVYLVNIKQFMDDFFKTGISVSISSADVSDDVLGRSYEISTSSSIESEIELGDPRDEPLFVEKFKARRLHFAAKRAIRNSTMRRLLEELAEVLTNSGSHSRVVIRCADCDCPFLLSRKGQAFCSHRCSARAGERRRYKARHIQTID